MSSRTFLTLALAVGLAVSTAQAQDGDPYGMDLPIDPALYHSYQNDPANVDKTVTGDLPSGNDQEPEPTEEKEPVTFFGEEVPGDTSVIYVIDRSSSMWLTMSSYVDASGNTMMDPTRFEVAKAELRSSIMNLDENFTFNIIFYHECVCSWRESRVKATDENKQQAIEFIEAMSPAGWTNTGVATALALEDKQNTTVVLLSDGAPNYLDCTQSLVGSFDDHARIIRDANTQSARVNTFGLGLSDQARSFLRRVASENNGIFIEIN